MLSIISYQNKALILSLIILVKFRSSLAQEASSSSSEFLLNDFHAKNQALQKNPLGSFNQYAIQNPYNENVSSPKMKLENLKNVNFQISNDELVNKQRRFAILKLKDERSGFLPTTNRRNTVGSENPIDSISSESQISGKVYTYPKHLQAKKRNKEQDISFRRDSTPAFLQQVNPTNVPVQDEGEEENLENSQIQDENRQGFESRSPYSNQFSYFGSSDRPRSFPLVACKLNQQVTSIQYQVIPTCHHFIGYPVPMHGSFVVNPNVVLQDLKSYQWQLNQSPIMNVLFSPATVSMTPTPLVWPSKLKTRKYLPPYISSPNRVTSVPGINFRQGYELPNSQQTLGITDRQPIEPQMLVTSPINGNIGNNFQQKKPYISPNLRAKKPIETSDGIDVRMDKNSDDIPNTLVENNSLIKNDETVSETLQAFDESNEKEASTHNNPILELTELDNQASKRQFLVSVINSKSQNNNFDYQESKIPNNKLLIMNQVKEDSNKRDSQQSQEVKVESKEVNDDEKEPSKPAELE